MKFINSNWKPSLAIKVSVVIHISALIALVSGVSWVWVSSVVVANHALLIIAGLWPRSSLLGANMLTIPLKPGYANHVVITIDDGPNPAVTPAVLDILDIFNAKASFFCLGKSVEAHPQLARDIIARGHSIENHSYGHPHHFSLLGMQGLQRELSTTQDIIFQVTGYMPKYFRAPAGLRSPLLDPVLQQLNLKLVSWTRRGFDTTTRNPAVVLQRLERNLAAGDILLLHDNHCAITLQEQPVILEVLPKLLSTLENLNLRAVSLNSAFSKPY